MINLLPPDKKKEIFLANIQKMILLFGGIFVSASLCFCLILFAVKYFIMSESVMASSELAMLRGKEGEKINLDKYNKIFPDLVAVYGQKVHMFEVVDNILAVKSEFISFSLVSIQRAPKNSILVKISGNAVSREDLLKLKGVMEKNNNFKNIIFSPNSWINEKNPAFNLSFTYEISNIE